MKCEICKKDTFIIHINGEHQLVCPECYKPDKKNDPVDKHETDEKRIGCKIEVLYE